MSEPTGLSRHDTPADTPRPDGGDPPPANRAERRAARRGSKQDATPRHAATPQRLHGRDAIAASRRYDRRRNG